jgi:acyl-CoA synthetase (NDP forming)
VTLDGHRTLLPEPEVKRMLAACGITVPAGVVAPADGSIDASELRAPLVLKAFGAGIVHKSDVGAVVLGLDHASLPSAISDLRDRVVGHGCAPDGFLVEEQAAPGVELMVGMIRGPFGVTVAVGLGGTLAELLDDVTVRLAPLARGDAEALLDGFRAAGMLRGARGRPPVDREALVDLLLRLAGPAGLVNELDLSELDLNPVIATPAGATVVDARLILQKSEDVVAPPAKPVDFDALFAPRTIAIAGVSTNRPGFGNRALAAYRAFGWTDGLSVIHPTANAVDGVPAYPSIADVPGGVDYVLAAVPAPACAELVRSAAGHARVVHVISGGFAEAGADGRSLEHDLLAAARDARVRVVGPNCIGIYAPAGRQTFQLDVPADSGAVSVVSQSGGLAGDIVKVGAARGVRFAKVASIGNAVDVTPGEVVEYFLADDTTRVIGAYLEGARDGERLVAALRDARGVKPVVVLTGGLSRQGAAAAVSHTGTLTSDRRVWDAIRATTGAAVVERLEDFLGALVFAQAFSDRPASGDPGVLIVGVGGGASVLATDAADRAGLACTAVPPAAVAALRGLGYGAGTSVTNPIEIGVGPAAPVDVFEPVLDAVLADRTYPDVMLHVNVQAYYSYGTVGAGPLGALIESVGAAISGGRYPSSRVVMVTRNLDVAPGADADAVLEAAATAGVPTYRTFDEATTAIAAGKQFARSRGAHDG